MLMIRLSFALGIAMGLVMLWGIWSNGVSGVRSASWPSIRGEVIEVYVIRTPSARNVTSESWFVRYQYTVHDAEYIASTLSFDQRQAIGGPWMKTTYPAGKKVMVYYDPDDPATSCLLPGENSLVQLLGLSVMALVILGLVIFGWIDFEKRHR
jgi:hypothetical protein